SGVARGLRVGGPGLVVVAGRDLGSGGVDDVVDGAGAAQDRGDHVVELHVGAGGRLDGVPEDEGRVVAQVGVDAHAPCLVRRHGVGDLVGGVAEVAAAGGPAALVGHVVRGLALVEVHAAAVGVPGGLVLLVVLDGEPVHRDVGAVDDQALHRRVGV